MRYRLFTCECEYRYQYESSGTITEIIAKKLAILIEEVEREGYRIVSHSIVGDVEFGDSNEVFITIIAELRS